MKSTRFPRSILRALLGGAAFFIALSLSAAGQVKTLTSESQDTATEEVTVERGEIVYVKGNTLIVKMDDGELESFENVPASTSFMIEGKAVNIHTAKVGMILEKQTVKTTTPKVITTVKSVTGKVWNVSPPKSVILTLEDGTNQEFNIPDGQRFMVAGKETDAWGLKKGMTVKAQRVTEVPLTTFAETIKRTGKMPQPPAAPLNGDLPLLVVATMLAPPPPPAP